MKFAGFLMRQAQNAETTGLVFLPSRKGIFPMERGKLDDANTEIRKRLTCPESGN